jgi:16S rRNA (adenine1518-N6/adenine1519-N6)-dimethyltransferase
VRALLAAHDLHPDRRLGQHYLVDPNTARKIPRLAGVTPGETVLEVGPGLGSLTLALREAGCTVVAVEADRRLLAPLAEVLAGEGVSIGGADAARFTGAPLRGSPDPSGPPNPPGVRVEHGDALRVDLAALAPAARRLVANLPYSIAVPLVLRVLAEFPQFASLTVMVQREVGERLVAPPGSPAYGAPSVKVAALASVRLLAPVSRQVFLPVPHVDSVLVGITRQPHPALERVGYAAVARVIDAAFSQRRKTVRNALRPLGLDAEQAETAARNAGVDPASRPERLDVVAFVALAEAVAAR